MLIRLARPDDAATIAAIYRPAVVERATSFELEPPSSDEMAMRMGKIAGRTPWLVCEREGTVVGYAYAGSHRERAAYQWSAEVSAYVDDSAQRAGVGRALYTSLFALLVLQGYRNAVAGITLPNPASEGLHRSLGFMTVGVFRGIGYKVGQWHDVLWLERPLAARIADPTPPRALADILPSFEAGAAMAAGLAFLRSRVSSQP